jgi:hypothetical protein
MSGDIAKLFRHGETKAPGVLAIDAPPSDATLMAREVIQNSWDAARELDSTLEGAAHQFEIDFRFREVSGEEKAALVEALGLPSLAERAALVDRRDVGLPGGDCLESLESAEPLRVLEITELGASGMYGPWSQNKSHMYLALVSLGYTEKFEGAGGSYGYGKAGLINGSRIRTVLAYSCFRERPDDPDVTRRLLGMAYWGPHDHDGENFTGFGSFSARSDSILPFVNDEADEIASSLGFDTRDPGAVEQLGTTFMVVDPTIQPTDLLSAIERSWWPALHEGEFIVRVVDYDGTVGYPRPRRDEVLRTFIDAWELVAGTREAGPDEYASELTGFDDYPVVGSLGLVADLNGWSYADETAGPEGQVVDHKSLVALTRGPRMVVEYLVVGHSEPYIRGAFMADLSIDDVLRRTEPPLHDTWQRKAGEADIDANAAKVADHILKRISQAYNNQRTRLKPQPPPPEDMNLPFFNEIMRRVMSGMGGGRRQPVPETRPISIHLDYEPVPAGERIKLKGSAAFSLSEHHEGDHAEVELSIVYRFLEDDRVGEQAVINVEGPDEMIEVEPGVFRGPLERHSEARLRFETQPYDPTWTGRLFVNGDIREGALEGEPPA